MQIKFQSMRIKSLFVNLEAEENITCPSEVLSSTETIQIQIIQISLFDSVSNLNKNTYFSCKFHIWLECKVEKTNKIRNMLAII